MNYSEQELAREVLYLHSLWDQGPPNSNPNFSSLHIPYHDHTFYRRPSSNRTPYSRPNPNPSSRCNNYRSSHLTPERSNEKQKREPTQENEWPCDPASVPEQSSPHAWAPFEQVVQTPPTMSPNSAARATLMSTQLSAIQSCKGFFSQDSDSESEYESESENDVDEFFRDLFENDAGLRCSYEKDHDNGEFYCLVCETRRYGKKRKGKMYRGCVALAKHASAVGKAGRRAAHQAFARAICLVLGWDTQRLPSIVLLPGSVVKADHSEDKQETGAIQNPNSTSDSPEIGKRDTNEDPPGPTLRREPANVPGTGACYPPKVVPEEGDSGTKKFSKGKDSDQEENFENDIKEDSIGIVLKIVGCTGSKEEQAGTTSLEAIDLVNSGSPVEDKKEGTSYDASSDNFHRSSIFFWQ